MLEKIKKYAKPGLDALCEIGFTLAVSFGFILMAGYAYALKNDGVDVANAIMKIASRNIAPEETFGYILGFLAPAMWIMVRYRDRWKHSLLLVYLLAGQIIVTITATILFVMSSSKIVENNELASSSSWILLSAALIAWYLTLWYNKAILEEAEKQINHPTPDNESGSDILASLRSKK